MSPSSSGLAPWIVDILAVCPELLGRPCCKPPEGEVERFRVENAFCSPTHDRSNVALDPVFGLVERAAKVSNFRFALRTRGILVFLASAPATDLLTKAKSSHRSPPRAPPRFRSWVDIIAAL